MAKYALALCLALAAGMCLAGAASEGAGPAVDPDPQPWQIDDDETPSSTRKLQSLHEGQKWSPGYISSTLAEAWADVMRITAEAKANKTKMLSPEVMPQPIPLPLPGKSKNFSFTSIRLSSSATFPNGGGVLSPSPGPAPSPPPIIDSVGTAAGAPTSPFVTTPTPGGANPFVTTAAPAPSGARAAEVSGARPAEVAPSGARSGAAVTAQSQKQTPEDLQAKLAALQAQLVELEAMKQQLKAMSPPPPSSGRRLLDSGEPGWDAGALLQKMIDLASMDVDILQRRLEDRAAGIGDSFEGFQDLAGIFLDAGGRILGAGEDRFAELADYLRNRGMAGAGNLQDTLGWLMEARAARRRGWLHG